MSLPRARRGSTGVFDFEGAGDAARDWMDHAYGTTFRMTGPLGAVRHRRRDVGGIAFDHIAVDAVFTFDSDPMPQLVVTDVLGGVVEYTRDDVTDRADDGQSVLAAGWDMSFTGRSDGYDIRTTAIGPAAVRAAVEDVVPDYPWQELRFTSYVPRTPVAGARWRATVDELSRSFPDVGTMAHDEASRLLGNTLLDTFPNTVVDEARRRVADGDARDVTPSTVRLAARTIEDRALDGLDLASIARECGVSTRALQYAFRRQLGCTPSAYLQRIRLDLARQALRDGSSASVTDAATRCGFFNPGRFATAYRDTFGEYPRDTLARATP